MYKYCQQDTDTVTLHDCIATGIRLENGELSLDFADGIWLCEDNYHNETGTTVRTDSANVTVKNICITDVCVRKSFSLFGGIYTKQVTDDIETLIKNVKSGEWTLEFLYEYLHRSNKLFVCCVHDKRGGVYECGIEFLYTDIEYRWNGICPDRKW